MLRPLSSDIVRGIVRPGIWIAAVSGFHQDEQDVTSSMVSTTLSIGNTMLFAVANGNAVGQPSTAHAVTVAENIRLASWLAAAGTLVSLLAAPALLRKASVIGL